MTDTPRAPEEGVVGDGNARELAIQRLKMKQDFTEADVQREMRRG